MTHPDVAPPLPTPDAASWRATVLGLGPQLEERAARHDAQNTFVAESVAELRAAGFLAVGIPTELGGAGLTQAEVAELLREMAQFCPATALTLAMHQHLVGAAVWRFRHGQPGEALLRRVAGEHLLLISTGARDWLRSSGLITPVEGGYRVQARKAFASGCLSGDLLLTSAVLSCSEQVAHFVVSLSAPGVSIEEDWNSLGMRGTGSHTAVLEDVFVPEKAVSLTRPRGEWHPSWSVVLGAALPLIMAVYVGVAEAAAAKATARARQAPPTPERLLSLGEMVNALTTAQLASADLLRLADNYRFDAGLALADAVLVRKSICARAVLDTVHRALETVGGVGLFRTFGLERLLRDAHGAAFHPLPERAQQLFTARVALGLDVAAPWQQTAVDPEVHPAQSNISGLP
ncbi:acyl-CoA dehydrogenase family protein [Deinococcus humi]|uniref:Acyl-CoA dehydrogenase n=1 Tax=Deinococcus humi TaxID=662880 RepID=A0A7W8NGY7_9DEIO|nr:acyl-CoA dehydrogenase family protein [Deinococcus humi]MBB5365295.1 acyl-CoA dehydrogenase [Deinococcus humi]GGO35934.1 BEC protein [Deinococcus humi]